MYVCILVCVYVIESECAHTLFQSLTCSLYVHTSPVRTVHPLLQCVQIVNIDLTSMSLGGEKNTASVAIK